MTGIIKSSHASERVRTPPLVPPAFGRSQTIVAESELEKAQARQALHQAELERLREQIEQARTQGEEEGRKAGFVEGNAFADRAIEALKQGVTDAKTRLVQDLSEMERLAAALASSAIERVLGPDANQGNLVRQIVARQARSVETQALLLIEVSSQDFPDEAALKSLRGANVAFGAEVKSNPSLESGACRMKLRLGALEVGPAQQWSALASALAKMSAPTVKK